MHPLTCPIDYFSKSGFDADSELLAVQIVLFFSITKLLAVLRCVRFKISTEHTHRMASAFRRFILLKNQSQNVKEKIDKSSKPFRIQRHLFSQSIKKKRTIRRPKLTHVNNFLLVYLLLKEIYFCVMYFVLYVPIYCCLNGTTKCTWQCVCVCVLRVSVLMCRMCQMLLK